jgi:cytochrome b involved in lipid metabolism
VPASAHQPVALLNSDTTAARGPLLVDGTVSFAVTASFNKAGERKGFRANFAAGDSVQVQYLIIDKRPENKLKNNQLPTVVVTSPSGKRLTLPINERTKFFEPHGGTNYLYLSRISAVAESGIYSFLITARAKSSITVAVGDREVPGTVTRGALPPVATATPTATPTRAATPKPQNSATTQTSLNYPRPLITPDNECPRLVSIKFEKTRLTPFETTKLRIEVKDNLNSVMPISLGMRSAIWWGQIGLLSPADYKLSNFTVTSSEIVDGSVREIFSIDFQAPSAIGKWNFARLWLFDRSEIKANYDRDGFFDCKTGDFVPASYPEADFEVIESPSPSPTPTPTPTVAKSGYTMADVRANATSAKCWSAIDGNVYDLTRWISSHPGGASPIRFLCGIDGTNAFKAQHANQSSPMARLSSYLLGPLTP